MPSFYKLQSLNRFGASLQPTKKRCSLQIDGQTQVDYQVIRCAQGKDTPKGIRILLVEDGFTWGYFIYNLADGSIPPGCQDDLIPLMLRRSTKRACPGPLVKPGYILVPWFLRQHGFLEAFLGIATICIRIVNYNGFHGIILA